MSNFKVAEDGTGTIIYSREDIIIEFDLNETVDLLNSYEKVLNKTLKKAKQCNNELYESILKDMIRTVYGRINLK